LEKDLQVVIRFEHDPNINRLFRNSLLYFSYATCAKYQNIGTEEQLIS